MQVMVLLHSLGDVHFFCVFIVLFALISHCCISELYLVSFTVYCAAVLLCVKALCYVLVLGIRHFIPMYVEE